MSTARTLVVTCAGWGVYVTWSWFLTAPLASAPASTASTTSALSTSFAKSDPSPPTVAAHLVGIVEPIEESGSKTVAEAADRLSRIDWLAVKIRQRQPASEPRWLAEGMLQSGPNGCTRLVMSYKSGDRETHSSEMICDGRVLAQVIHHPGQGPEIAGWELPKSPAAREEMLNKYGCGGPHALLNHLASRVTTWTVAHVRQGDRDHVQTTGVFLEDAPKDAMGRKLAPQRKVVRLSFEAATLWLDRLEWWSDAPDAGGQLLWEQEYLEPRIGEALSLEECARLFSYRAD
jgi:hypothetical protein